MPAADRPKRTLAKPSPKFAPEPPKPAGSWAPSKILTRVSGVANKDVRTFLLTCITGWNNYTAEEQREIINTLPLTRRTYDLDPETGKLSCPLNADFVVTDAHLKRAVSRFQTDISEGNYTTSWQKKARQAMKERAEGRFDEYVRQHADDRFGDDESRDPSVFSAVGDTVDPAPLNPPQQQGPSRHDDSSDGEWDPTAKQFGMSAAGDTETKA